MPLKLLYEEIGGLHWSTTLPIKEYKCGFCPFHHLTVGVEGLILEFNACLRYYWDSCLNHKLVVIVGGF